MGLTARAVLHELDHLDGHLYTELVSTSALVDTSRLDARGRIAAFFGRHLRDGG